jgi:hypothetical protein
MSVLVHLFIKEISTSPLETLGFLLIHFGKQQFNRLFFVILRSDLCELEEMEGKWSVQKNIEAFVELQNCNFRGDCFCKMFKNKWKLDGFVTRMEQKAPHGFVGHF